MRFFVLGYDWLVVKNTGLCLAGLLCVLGFFALYIQDFQLDASADTLLLEDDVDLQILRSLQARYETKDFLFLTFTPHADLFADESLALIAELQTKLMGLPLTDSLVSLLDVPLVKQVEGSLAEVTSDYQTLRSINVDKVKARAELIASPIFQELVVSKDGNTTALQINLRDNAGLIALQQERLLLLQKKRARSLSVAEALELQIISDEYDLLRDLARQENHENIVSIRSIMGEYERFGSLHLGGVAMITDDMVSFIKKDLVVFGIGVLFFLIAMLGWIFRRLRWVALPLFSCVYSGMIMVGLLGFVGWSVTVISANFISLMLIITMSMNIHLVVRYRQLIRDFPDLTHADLVMQMVTKMVLPCLYTALTTIIAFASLVFSGIKPVIDFGWMMVAGLMVAFLTTFLLFPCVLVLLDKMPEKDERGSEIGGQIMPLLAHVTLVHGGKVLFVSALLMVGGVVGVSMLTVENSFINYFAEDTEIYQGLKLIDDKLGGTTSMDVVIKFEEPIAVVAEPDDDFDFDFAALSGDSDGYWFTPYKLEQIKVVHDYLDSLPAVGKVLSLASLIRVGEDVNNGSFDAFELAVVYKRMPMDLRASMIDPYISIADNEARINLRVLDSFPDLRRKQFLQEIEATLTGELGFDHDQITISGLLVLYNNMLQSLFRSQILTLGVVMIGIFLVLLVLFRSFSLAFIGIVPNMLASLIILGLIGLLRIPLDMMTITIAAITIGIAVDNSIHYIYRFREEFAKIGDYDKTLTHCHVYIGKAIFYNAITIVSGFSILALSNFVPTIYFGLLTACAMTVALLGALTLLPKLMLLMRPFSVKTV